MSSFLCDLCDAEFAGGQTGSVFLVLADGKTARFCSSACLRSHVNRHSPALVPVNYARTMGLVAAMVWLGTIVAAKLILHVIR
jgi:ribosomal protein L24E